MSLPSTGSLAHGTLRSSVLGPQHPNLYFPFPSSPELPCPTLIWPQDMCPYILSHLGTGRAPISHARTLSDKIVAMYTWWGMKVHATAGRSCLAIDVARVATCRGSAGQTGRTPSGPSFSVTT